MLSTQKLMCCSISKGFYATDMPTVHLRFGNGTNLCTHLCDL